MVCGSGGGSQAKKVQKKQKGHQLINSTHSQSLAFGGVKDSGFGRFGGIDMPLRDCEAAATSTSSRTAMRHGMPTSIPKALGYPLVPQAPPGRIAHGRVRPLVKV